MKTRIVILCAGLVIIFSSCLIKSLHPFFKEKDVIFRKELIGTWLDQNSDTWTISQSEVISSGSLIGKQSGDSLLKFYKVTLNSKNKDSKFIAHLFKLNDQLFVDFFPDDIEIAELTSYHFVGAHSIAKIEVFADSILLKWFNEIWLAELFKNKKIKISHETTEDSYILTASTDELQKFLIKYGKDPNAFIDKPEDPKNGEEILCFSLTRIKE